MNKTAEDYLKSHKLAVMATVGADGKPEAATVAFTLSGDGVIIVATSSASRKFHNIESGSEVALVVGWEDKTVQIEGNAVLLKDESVIEKYEAEHLVNNPGSVDYAKQPDQKYIIIHPKWLRFTDFRSMPPTVEEENL